MNETEAITFLPEYIYGFEFNGDYRKVLQRSHDMDFEKYHVFKRKLALTKNIKIFFIWQNDWENNNEEIIEALTQLYEKNTVSDILNKTIGING